MTPHPNTKVFVQRRLEFDGLRGLILVWMTIMHLPTRANTIFNQPFGCVSSAEGFVFLAAKANSFDAWRNGNFEQRQCCKFELTYWAIVSLDIKIVLSMC
jgi:hypothetical protein